jgi:hypothetical protein
MINKLSSPYIFAGKADKSKPAITSPPAPGTDEYYAARRKAKKIKSVKPIDLSKEPEGGYISFIPKITQVKNWNSQQPKKQKKARVSKASTPTPHKKPPTQKAVIEELKRRVRRLSETSNETLDSVMQLIFDDKKVKITPDQVIAKTREDAEITPSEETASKMIDLFEEVSQTNIRRKAPKLKA